MAEAKTRREVEKEVKEMFGFVPDFYKALPDHGVGAAWSLQRDLQLAETALDPKVKELIGLSVASHIKCKYCIYFHTRAAETFGASPQEIREAITMGGLTVMMSNSLTGTRTDFDDFKRDVDRAIEHLAAQTK